MNIRLAMEEDIDQLIKMRWDFTKEYSEIEEMPYDDFYNECKTFLLKEIYGDRWKFWVAEINGKVISHVFVQLIDKVPRPGRMTRPFGYVTNVYTLPQYRGQKIGSELNSKMKEWANEEKLEFLIVWPSSKSVDFYLRNGYKKAEEPMEIYF